MLTESANVILPTEARRGPKNQSSFLREKYTPYFNFHRRFTDQLQHTFHVMSARTEYLTVSRDQSAGRNRDTKTYDKSSGGVEQLKLLSTTVTN